ncbi:MAG: TubC N-terminal docking domain-related protein [Acidiferrobacterales bacterium]
MSAALDLLREADRLKIRLQLDGGDIVAEGPLTNELVERLRAHKAELLALLSDSSSSSLYGVPLEDLQDAAGADWPEVESDPDLLETLARAVQIRRLREQGEVPAHYTATTTCRHCGPVPIFPGVGPTVEACPWCFNRLTGLPVPAEVGDRA